MIRRVCVSLLAIGAMGGLAACGADDEKADGKSGATASAPAASSAAELAWARRVSDVCVRNRRAVRRIAEKVVEEFPGLPRNELIVTAMERGIPTEKRLMVELRALRAPDPIASEYETFLDRIDAGIDLFPRLAQVVRSNTNDPELTSELKEIAATTRPFAWAHHLKACLPDQN